MAVNPSAFGPKPQFVDVAGNPAVGYQLFFYVAGSTSTKQDTFTDSTGLVANTNPIVLNVLGEPSTQIWWPAGQSFKVVLAPPTDTDPPTSPVWTVDNLYGINDFTNSPAQSEWVLSPLTPTFVNATTFTVPGNQTADFQVNRRIKSSNTAGLAYGNIISSAFTTLTTVTLLNTSGALDSGLSAVSYGLLSATNRSIPATASAAMQSFSGSTTTFSSVPAGTKTILIPIRNMRSSGTNTPLLQLGSSAGLVTSGYLGTSTNQVAGGVSVGVTFGSGFGLSGTSTAAAIVHGVISLTLLDAATFLWACAISLGRSDTAISITGGGTIALPGTLDRFAVTVGGDTFTGGTIGGLYGF